VRATFYRWSLWKSIPASNEPYGTFAGFRSGFSGGLGLLGFHGS
jgi:hypothetical protein